VASSSKRAGVFAVRGDEPPRPAAAAVLPARRPNARPSSPGIATSSSTTRRGCRAAIAARCCRRRLAPAHAARASVSLHQRAQPRAREQLVVDDHHRHGGARSDIAQRLRCSQRPPSVLRTVPPKGERVLRTGRRRSQRHRHARMECRRSARSRATAAEVVQQLRRSRTLSSAMPVRGAQSVSGRCC